MAKQKVEYTFDIGKKKRELAEKKKKAQKVLDQTVLTDCNFFIPKDTSHLEKSSIEKTVIGSGVVRWVTPYARVQYYEYRNKSHLKNPNATYKWCESAKARHKKKWLELVKNEYHRNP
ncbi:MAG: minor capsid protein [Treponema sp.]|nr:minor capsid protein [Treponema sp.]